jgi:hypothetical protein
MRLPVQRPCALRPGYELFLGSLPSETRQPRDRVRRQERGSAFEGAGAPLAR